MSLWYCCGILLLILTETTVDGFGTIHSFKENLNRVYGGSTGSLRSPTPVGSTPPPNSDEPPSTEIIPLEKEIKLKQSLVIYYSAMDGSSQLLFNTTLTALFEDFFPVVDFNFVPFQNAITVKGQLYCPSSVDSLCTVDLAHVCAINVIEDKQALYKFLACTMTSTDALPDLQTCASSCNVDYSKIDACINSPWGIRLAWDIIEEHVNPACITTPCFVFGEYDSITPDSYNNIDNFACVTNLGDALCGKLRHNSMIPPSLLPTNCTQSISVQIFYKVMDEASQGLIKGLQPIYEKFSETCHFQFTPCMFSELRSNNGLKCGEDDYVDKDCQAGIVQSCAINTMSSNPVGLFQFLSCTMQDHTKLPDFEKCAKDNNLNFDPIKDCVDKGKGAYLCYENGKRRFTENPPSIVFDLIYNEQHSEFAKQNIQLGLCQQLKTYNIAHPDECKGSLKLSIFFYSLELEFPFWVRNTLTKMYALFSKYVVFDLIPCRTAETDQAELKCRNALDPKCYGDKYIACAKKQIKDQTELLVELLVCLSQDHCGDLPPYEACAKSISLDHSALDACANGPDGVKFCTDSFQKGPQLDQSLVFQINDGWEEEINNDIKSDFVRALCDRAQTDNLSFPNECFEVPPDVLPEEEDP